MEVWRAGVDPQGSGEILEAVDGMLRALGDAQNKGPWGSDSRDSQNTQGCVSLIKREQHSVNERWY